VRTSEEKINIDRTGVIHGLIPMDREQRRDAVRIPDSKCKSRGIHGGTFFSPVRVRLKDHFSIGVLFKARRLVPTGTNFAEVVDLSVVDDPVAVAGSFMAGATRGRGPRLRAAVS